MRIYVAGSTGVVGRKLVPLLMDEGHEVVALVRNREKAPEVAGMGAIATVADPLDPGALTASIRESRPEVVIHQLTGLARAGDFKRFDEEFALTNRFRTEVTRTMIEAARNAGARRVIVQSFCGWPFARMGGPVKTEEDPLDPDPPAPFRKTHEAIRLQEELIQGTRDLEALALRYGFFYGPGTSIARDGIIVRYVRERKLPIIGNGAGIWSFIHIDDVVRATLAAVTSGSPGIYNIVDDEPAPVTEWLPALATAIGARPPRHIPTWLGQLAVGEGGIALMTTARGGSNGKARRMLDWKPIYPSWRFGFVQGLG